jgi:hypothetical protein
MAGFTGAAGRTGEFAAGTTGDPDSAASSMNQDPGLNLSSIQFNAQVPKGAVPTSVLVPIEKNPGNLGMSAADASRRTLDGTYLGSVNGTSASSFVPAAMRRLSGLDAE